MSTRFLAYVVVQCCSCSRICMYEYGGRLRFGRRFWCSFLVPGQQKTHFNGCDETGSAVADLDMYSYIQRLRTKWGGFRGTWMSVSTYEHIKLINLHPDFPDAHAWRSSFWRRSAVLRHVSEDATVSGLDIHGSMAVVSGMVFGPYQHGIHGTGQMVQVENCIGEYLILQVDTVLCRFILYIAEGTLSVVYIL